MCYGQMRGRIRSLCILVLVLSFVCPSSSVVGRIGILARMHAVDGTFMGVARQRVTAAAVLAVNHVNRRVATIVKDAQKLHWNFSLAYQLEDTFSDPSRGVELTVGFQQTGIHYIVGASRSAVTAPVSLVASTKTVPVISYASTAPELSEKSTHPLFSRTISGDDTTALAITVSCFGLGWRNIAVMYTDDTYGRGYAEALASSASTIGISILSSSKYKQGDLAGIATGTQTIRDSGARIIVLVAYTSDLTAVVEAAQAAGIAGGGYVWLLSDSVQEPQTVLDQSPNPDMVNILSGFNQVKAAPLYGEGAQRFLDMWATTPLADLENDLFDVHAAPELLGPCNELCALIYDAVWSAAFALSRAADHTSHTIDLAALAPTTRLLNFSGASGTVAFHPETGDRFPGSIPLTVTNWQPSTRADGSPTLKSVEFMVWDHLNGLQRIPLAEPPYWPGQRQGWDVPLDGSTCPAGTVLSDATLKCEPCSPGHYRAAGAATSTCLPCEEGRIAPFEGMTQCIPCSEGYAPERGLAECVPCPANTQRLAGSPGLNASECTCNRDFFFAGDADGSCRQCVAGGVCPGQDYSPYPMTHFWGDTECSTYGGWRDCKDPYQFIQCNPTEFCLANFTCAAGHTGRLCQKAQPGWFFLGRLWMLKCGDNGKLTSSLMIVAVFVIWFGMNKVASGNYDALDIGLLFVQITGMIASYGLKWHSNLRPLKIGLDVANFDVDFVSPNCLFEWTEASSFYLQLFLPFFFGFSYFLYFLFELKVLSKWSWTNRGRTGLSMQTVRSDTARSFISFLLVVYHTLCLKCFQIFSCDGFPNGNYYVALAPEIQCWTQEHWIMVGISGLYIILVIIGIPIWMFVCVIRHTANNTLNEPLTLRTWSFIHVRYENDYKWWEAMLLLRRLSIALVSVSIKTSMIQASVSIVILTVLLASHVYTRPYVEETVDALDFVSICGSMIYVLAGMLMYPSITARSQGLVCTERADDPYCAYDLEIKEIVSLITLVSSAVTIATAVVISARFILEQTKQAKASVLVKDLVVGGTEMQDVEDTVNKVTLDAILKGEKLLKWAAKLKETGQQQTSDLDSTARLPSGSPLSVTNPALPRFSGPVEAAAFMEVERGIRQLEVDVTDNSSRPLARVLRSLTGIPGVIDWLTLTSEAERRTVLPIVEDLAHFIEEAEKRHGAQSLSVTEMVREEHRPVIILFLISCTKHQRKCFIRVMDGLLRDNEAPTNHSIFVHKHVPPGQNGHGNGMLQASKSLRRWTEDEEHDLSVSRTRRSLQVKKGEQPPEDNKSMRGRLRDQLDEDDREQSLQGDKEEEEEVVEGKLAVRDGSGSESAQFFSELTQVPPIFPSQTVAGKLQPPRKLPKVHFGNGHAEENGNGGQNGTGHCNGHGNGNGNGSEGLGKGMEEAAAANGWAERDGEGVQAQVVLMDVDLFAARGGGGRGGDGHGGSGEGGRGGEGENGARGRGERGGGSSIPRDTEIEISLGTAGERVVRPRVEALPLPDQESRVTFPRIVRLSPPVADFQTPRDHERGSTPSSSGSLMC